MTDHRDDTEEWEDDMTDVHALSGAYAVDAVDDDERARFEEHLRHCPACRIEVDSLREATAVLAADAEAAPPPGLRDRLLAGIETVRPLPPLTHETGGPGGPDGPHRPDGPDGPDGAAPPAPTSLTGRQGRRARRGIFRLAGPQLLVAAAAVVVLLTAATLAWRPWSVEEAPAPTAAERVLQAEDAMRVSKELPGGARATVVLSRSEGRAVLLTEDMGRAEEGKDYQLWLETPRGAMEPAGIMPHEPDATVVLEGDAAEATAVGITVEPAGGSPEPTGAPIALFQLDDA